MGSFPETYNDPWERCLFLHQLFIIFLTASGSVISVTPSTLNVIEGDEALFECLVVGPDSYNSLVT